MKYNMSCWFFGQFYHSACKKELKKKGFSRQMIAEGAEFCDFRYSRPKVTEG